MILITGATGMFGSRVLRETLARQAEVRALVHSPANAEQVRAGGADVVVGDLDEPESLASVFAGVDTAFIVSPMDERLAIREANALQAAQEAGVRRIVKLYGAVRHHGDPLDALHLASIEAIRESGLSWPVKEWVAAHQDAFAQAGGDGVVAAGGLGSQALFLHVHFRDHASAGEPPVRLPTSVTAFAADASPLPHS